MPLNPTNFVDEFSRSPGANDKFLRNESPVQVKYSFLLLPLSSEPVRR